MLVDDDPAFRYVATRWLQGDGWEVMTAVDGEDALQQLRTAARPPGLILLDILMPRMDGNAFREEQLRDPHLRKLPVVALTVLPSSDPRARSGRFDSYCQKGVDPGMLLRVVKLQCD